MLSVLLNQKISDNSKYILNGWESNKQPYNTGLDIKGDYIYNVCPGTVIFVGMSNNLYVVNVRINSNQLIRYSNLKSVDVESGDYVDINDSIGVAKEFVRLEYCLADKGTSKWPVRINNIDWYKHDPTGLLDGKLTLNPEYTVTYADSSSDAYIEFTKYQEDEFSDNRGE